MICSCNGGRFRRQSVRILRRRTLTDGVDRTLTDGVDRISDLPDDLLVQILAGLDCTRSAARTGALSKRWNQLWTRLPEVVFRDIDPDLLHAALRQVDSKIPAPPSLLEFRLSAEGISPGRISSWLHAAARLHPLNLIVHVEAVQGGRNVVLPRLDRAESIALDLCGHGVRFALPRASDFPKLQSLSLGPCADYFDLRGLVAPRNFSALHRLSLSYSCPHSIEINLPLLEELFIRVRFGEIQHVDIVAPRLNRLEFDASLLTITGYDLMSSAPQVEELSCRWKSCMQNVCFGRVWASCRMVLKTSEPSGLLPDCPPSNNMSLYIYDWGLGNVHYRSEFFFPVANLSILDLNIKLSLHAYGAIVLHLLEVYSSVRCLKVHLLDVGSDYDDCQTCKANCPCRHLNDLQDHCTSVNLLEEMQLTGFGGEDHEVDLFEVIVTIATNLKTVAVTLSDTASITDAGQCSSRVCSIVEANPNVKFNICTSSGQQVLLA